MMLLLHHSLLRESLTDAQRLLDSFTSRPDAKRTRLARSASGQKHSARAEAARHEHEDADACSCLRAIVCDRARDARVSTALPTSPRA